VQLKILTPFKVFLEVSEVLSLAIETPGGSYGFLPHRLDCVAPVAAGILTCRTASGDAYVAVDEGVLVKTGAEVLVSVRNAIGGQDLGQLRKAVEEQFLKLDDSEKEARAVTATLESGFIQRFAEFEHR
jgi:F-type H+-transporting ATPase subunit epsilon